MSTIKVNIIEPFSGDSITVSGSLNVTASNAVSASYATTASYALNGGGGGGVPMSMVVAMATVL